MKIFKFGGASSQNANGIRNIVNIIREFYDKNIIIVISAIGKTTNELERLVAAFFANSEEKYTLLDEIVSKHNAIMAELFDNTDSAAIADIQSQFHLLKNYLGKEPSENYNFEYDQIVPFGEIIA